MTGPVRRRGFLAALGAGSVLALSGCATYGGGISLTEAVRRLLVLSSERAFTRLTAPGGYWDESVARLGLDEFLGARGDVLSRILTSALFKSRLEDAVAEIAVDASYRAAPVVTDTVRAIGITNAVALVRGGPTAATAFLRQEMGMRLIDAMVPEVGDALRVADDPLVGQLLAGLTGVDVAGVARGFAGEVEEVIWQEIGREEAAIRADPAATRDPLLTAVFGAGAAL
ncbi:DUF4197 domain-containing protein [Altererythrobacter sp. B11]|uniref:DUF4197 domain-containing protein n=1 Tax=Altererythrobacter sp. B11 TaxID=2060312 RepID=UPI001E377380|nr:DUF4197 domain-containing protein [Altererythrobacter sp. B11]